MFGLSEVAGYLIVGIAAAIFPLVSAFLALRATKQTKKIDNTTHSIEIALGGQKGLIEDLQEDRDDLRRQVADLRAVVLSLRDDLDKCEAAKADLTREVYVQARRIADLERTG